MKADATLQTPSPPDCRGKIHNCQRTRVNGGGELAPMLNLFNTDNSRTVLLKNLVGKESRQDGGGCFVDDSPCSNSTLLTVSLSKSTTTNSSPLMRVVPTISVDNEGVAEVTLGSSFSFSSSSYHSSPGSTFSSSSSTLVITPRKDRCLARSMTALLDDEVTPTTITPTSASPETITSSLENREYPPSGGTIVGCCSLAISCLKGHDSGEGLGTDDLAKRISQLLGSTDQDQSWSTGWQAWTFFGKSEERKDKIEDADQVRENLQRVLKNRAFHHESRLKRLSSLRRNLSPFNQAQNLSSPNNLFKTRSFDMNRSVMTRAKLMPTKKTSQVPFWQCAMNCHLPQHDESPVVERSSFPVEDDECYDSDPEDFVRQSRKTISFSGQAVENKENGNPHLSDSRQSVKQRVQAFMNEQYTLILHENTFDEVTFAAPLHAVNVWVERGQYLQRGVIQPKLAWKALGHIDYKAKIAVQRADVSYVALLDIHRVIVVQKLDRKMHPFAKVQNCLIIKSLDRTLLLEASSKQERDRLVESLKLCVARLGSMLLSEDDNLVDEFFAGMDFGPGEEPYWLNQRLKK